MKISENLVIDKQFLNLFISGKSRAPFLRFSV